MSRKSIDRTWTGRPDRAKKRFEKQAILDPIIVQFTAVHNESPQLFLQKGLTGVLGWTAMFTAQFSVFFRASKTILQGIKRLGDSGLVVAFGSPTIGLKDISPMFNANRQMFLFLTMVWAVMIAVENKNLSSDAINEH